MKAARYINRFFEIATQQGLRKAVRSTLRFIWQRTKENIIVPTINPAYREFFEWRFGEGIDVMRKDWDNLILLDACRYDLFKECTTFKGDLSREVSQGYNSWDFIQENFEGRQLHDTVYVTANPHVELLDEDVFYTIESVLDKWDPQTGTVLPQDVTEAATNAQDEYPNKRLIVHYMQPHMPHLGETAKGYDEKVGVSGWDQFLFHEELGRKKEGTSLFQLYHQGQVSRSELIQSYKETLKIAESHVKELVNELTGKTVVSSDHGENLGGSPYGISLTGHTQESKECRFVPWLELPFDERKSITEDPPIGFEHLADEIVQNRLADLGYR